MANTLGGMFSPLIRDARQEQVDDENEALSIARLSPSDQAAYGAYTGYRDVGRGLERAIGAATGVDTRTPTAAHAENVAKAKAEIAALHLDADDPKTMDAFYRAAIEILRKNQLPAEALAMAKEYQAKKASDARQTLDSQRETRMAASDAAKAAAMIERNAIAREKLGAQAPEILKLLAEADKTNDPAKLTAITQRINKLVAGKVTAVDAGGFIQLVDAAGGEVRNIDKTPAPLSAKDTEKKEKDDKAHAAAYRATKTILNRIFTNIASLYNDPGVGAMTGQRFGLLPEAVIAAASQEGARAIEKYKQVSGEAFIQALNALKTASKNGSSGLGQLTEREGDKIQAAAAAIGRQQDTLDFLARLKEYAEKVSELGNLMDAEANGPVLPLPSVTLSSPLEKPAEKPRRRSTAAPAARPAASQADVRASEVQTADADDTVRIEKNGVFARVRRSELAAAKADKWKEAK